MANVVVLLTCIEGELSASLHRTVAEAEAVVREVWDEETFGVKLADLSGDALLDAVTRAYLPGAFYVAIQEVAEPGEG